MSLKETGYRELKEETKLDLPYEDGEVYNNTTVLKSNKYRVLFFIEQDVDISFVDRNHKLENEVDGVELVPFYRLVNKQSIGLKVRNQKGKKVYRHLEVCDHVQKFVGNVLANIPKNEPGTTELNNGGCSEEKTNDVN